MKLRWGIIRHTGTAVALCGLAGACLGTLPPGDDAGTQTDVTALTLHGDYPSALAELRMAPETAASLLDQANVLALLGRFDEVQTTLARVAAMLPSDPTLRSSIAIIRALVSLGRGETEPATRHARRAIDLIQVEDAADVDDAVRIIRVIRTIRIDALVILCRANVMARRVKAAQPFAVKRSSAQQPLHIPPSRH